MFKFHEILVLLYNSILLWIIGLLQAEHSRLFDEGENIEKTRSYEWNTGCVVKDINLNTSKTFESISYNYINSYLY